MDTLRGCLAFGAEIKGVEDTELNQVQLLREWLTGGFTILNLARVR